MILHKTFTLSHSYLTPQHFDIVQEIPSPLEEVFDEATKSVNVLFDFEAVAPDELSVVAGEMVQVVALVGDEWIKGGLRE